MIRRLGRANPVAPARRRRWDNRILRAMGFDVSCGETTKGFSFPQIFAQKKGKPRSASLPIKTNAKPTLTGDESHAS
jgi:hypothetical protein